LSASSIEPAGLVPSIGILVLMGIATGAIGLQRARSALIAR
jgi:hypothetical protein